MPFEAIGSGVDLKTASWSSDDTKWLYGPRLGFRNAEDDSDYLSDIPVDQDYNQLLTDIEQTNVEVLIDNLDVVPEAMMRDRNDAVINRTIKFSKTISNTHSCPRL